MHAGGCSRIPPVRPYGHYASDEAPLQQMLVVSLCSLDAKDDTLSKDVLNKTRAAGNYYTGPLEKRLQSID